MVDIVQHDPPSRNPRERFVWALRGLAFNQIPLTAPLDVLEEWSKHLSDCGFIHVAEVTDPVARSTLPEQTKWLQEPAAGPHSTVNPGVTWVDNEEDVRPQRFVDGFTPEQRAVLIHELREEGEL